MKAHKIATYKFMSDGHNISALTLPSFWQIVVDGQYKYRYEYDIEPATWLKVWAKLGDVEGVYTMLMEIPHQEIDK